MPGEVTPVLQFRCVGSHSGKCCLCHFNMVVVPTLTFEEMREKPRFDVAERIEVFDRAGIPSSPLVWSGKEGYPSV